MTNDFDVQGSATGAYLVVHLVGQLVGLQLESTRPFYPGAIFQETRGDAGWTQARQGIHLLVYYLRTEYVVSRAEQQKKKKKPGRPPSCLVDSHSSLAPGTFRVSGWILVLGESFSVELGYDTAHELGLPATSRAYGAH